MRSSVTQYCVLLERSLQLPQHQNPFSALRCLCRIGGCAVSGVSIVSLCLDGFLADTLPSQPWQAQYGLLLKVLGQKCTWLYSELRKSMEKQFVFPHCQRQCKLLTHSFQRSDDGEGACIGRVAGSQAPQLEGCQDHRACALDSKEVRRFKVRGRRLRAVLPHAWADLDDGAVDVV